LAAATTVFSQRVYECFVHSMDEDEQKRKKKKRKNTLREAESIFIKLFRCRVRDPFMFVIKRGEKKKGGRVPRPFLPCEDPFPILHSNTGQQLHHEGWEGERKKKGKGRKRSPSVPVTGAFDHHNSATNWKKEKATHRRRFSSADANQERGKREKGGEGGRADDYKSPGRIIFFSSFPRQIRKRGGKKKKRGEEVTTAFTSKRAIPPPPPKTHPRQKKKKKRKGGKGEHTWRAQI